MNNYIFQELIKKQRKNLIADKKLSLSDLKRVSSYLNSSIFTHECTLWSGYVTESKSSKKTSNLHFINFFFNGKKQALHRLLYYNFVDELNDNEYLKFSCENKGKCCCLEHIIKVNEKNKDEKELVDKSEELSENLEKTSENLEKKESKNKKIITVEF